MFSSLNLFTSLFIYRYLRLVVNVFAFSQLAPIPIPENPRLTSQDVTVVIPSIEGNGHVLWETIRSILATEPAEIILVTIHVNLEQARLMIKEMGTTRVRVFSVAYPNKRRQMVRAIPEVKTEVTIFADDDVLFPPSLLPWMLSPLEDETYGGVGTNQRIRRAESPTYEQRLYGYLNALYLERRNFDCASCMYMDGGLPCLSGRTVAYRSNILKDDAFTYSFTHEEWLGRYRLNADDDNFMTRWLVSHNKKIAFQYHKEAEVLTTLEDNPNFVKQCLRWARSNWRSNLTSMFWDRHVWRSQPWSTYAVFQTTIFQWSLISDCLLVYLYQQSTQNWDRDSWLIGLWTLLAWMFTSKFIKLLGHFVRYPVDFLLLPVSIVFGYLHCLIKAKAMLSLNVVSLPPSADAWLYPLSHHHFICLLSSICFWRCPRPISLSLAAPLRPVTPHDCEAPATNACPRWLTWYCKTAWGTRDGADDEDAARMVRVTFKEQDCRPHSNGILNPLARLEEKSEHVEQCERTV